MREAVRSADLTFLNMDRPTNLMVVNGVFWFDDEPDWDAVRSVIAERLVKRFPVLSRRPVQVDGSWFWEDDPAFDLAAHVRTVTLPVPDGGRHPGVDAAQSFIAHRFTQPLRRDRALWEIDMVRGLSGTDGAPVALLLGRFHHGVTDGIRIVQLLLSLCDVADAEDAAPPRVGRGARSAGPVRRTLSAGRHAAGDALDFALGAASASARSALALPRRVTRLRPGAVPDVVGRGVGYVVAPTRVTDAITSVASEDNQLVNSIRSAGRLLLSGRSPGVLGDGKPGVDKRVAWVTGIDLATVKAVGRRHGATVNDVLLAAVARGLVAYVREKGLEPAPAVNWLVPVSLTPMDANLPPELGNHFAMVMFPMPLAEVSEKDLLRETTSRMRRTKHSLEAMMVYGLQQVVAMTPPRVSVGVTDFVANKTVGVLTNVPGPQAPLYLAGTRITGILGWVPTASDQWLGVCLFSYAGTVSIGITSDAALLPDPGRLGELIKEQFEELSATTHATRATSTSTSMPSRSW